jgi:adenylate kinase family enzyme
LDIFEKETLPVIKYFEQIGKLIVVDADQPIDVVYKKFLEQLKEFGCV